jgi:phosphoserine phosphatase RsbU/P
MMREIPTTEESVLEIISPNRSRRLVPITASPFLIGRGEIGNNLQLADTRISRQCAAIVFQDGGYRLEDRGHRRGIHVNGNKIDHHVLEDGDVISFGLDDSYEIVFRSAAAGTTIQNILNRIDTVPAGEAASGGLGKLNLLLAATSLLHSQLPLDSVLGTMLDHAIMVTSADRGLLLEADSSGALRVRLARRSGGLRLSPESVAPSQTALRQALERQCGVITEDLAQAGLELQAAQSIVAQHLRAVVAVPLYAMHRASSAESVTQVHRKDLLGMVYLDSRRPAAFSKLDRDILDVLGVEAASILDNARLVERERQRQRLEQELSIAREIQQALLPCGLGDFPHLDVVGTNSPCLAVGGDYFDVFPMSDDRIAFLIADVSGKGLGAALLTTMLQGALTGMTIGVDPARVFNHINRFLCAHAELGKYATIFFGVLDLEGHLEFINAGHPSPILVRGGETSEPFTEGSCPVGLVPGAEYVAACMKLHPGDTLVLFSDGVSEAMDSEENIFGVARLRDILTGQHEAPLDRLQKTVLESVDQFSRGASQADDITLLLVRYRAAARNAAL